MRWLWALGAWAAANVTLVTMGAIITIGHPTLLTGLLVLNVIGGGGVLTGWLLHKAFPL